MTSTSIDCTLEEPMPTSMRGMPALYGALVPLLALTIACGDDGTHIQSASAQLADGESRVPIKTQPFNTDPCTWVTPAEVERLVGKLQGEPWRGKSAENPIRQDGGKACVYRLGGPDDNQEVVAVQVDHEDPMSYQAGYEMVSEAVGLGGKEEERAEPPSGWDFVSAVGRELVGRVGHLAVIVGVFAPNVPGDSLLKLASLVRDRVPDVPVAAEHADLAAPARGPDPCALVTREEAEGVLGKLALPPYRSKSTTPFADPSGEACSYYLGQHRVLAMTAHWSDAKWLFGTGAGLTDEVTSKLGVGEQSADTLDGPWDQSKGDIGGTLNFLTGDRMIEIQHRTANVDPGAAVKLARIAVARLAKAP